MGTDAMIIRPAFCCALLLGFVSSTWGADKAARKATVKPGAKTTLKVAPKAPQKTASKAAPTPTRKTSAKAAPATLKTAYKPASAPTASATAALQHGKTETLTCRDGTEDRHARIGVVLIGGKVDSFAYYSKWKPRTCSIYLQRTRDPYSKWTDKGSVTNVSLEQGLFLIEHGKGQYRFVFRDIDRERYCGMDGTLNGTLAIRKGTERCEVTGIMEEGVPLGQAYAHAEQTRPAVSAAASAAAPAVTPAGGSAAAPSPSLLSRWFGQRTRRVDDSAFPTPTPGPSD